MNIQTITCQSWHHTTVTRSTSVVPVYGFGMGDVRPLTLVEASGFDAVKRNADAAPAMVKGFQPWSPPVT